MTLVEGKYDIPAWDEQQRQVIFDAPSSWQLVIAGPGAGKTAVACQRIAHLVDAGVSPSRILLVSFTRTAVSELRNRIVSYAAIGDAARSVRISTVDAHAWSLRSGFDDKPALITGAYEVSIERTVALFREKQPDLIDFMSRLEHLIVDEAQDVLGSRADLVLEMLRNVSPDCGVTVLADPAQAIYGFTAEGKGPGDSQSALLDCLGRESPRSLTQRTLEHIHRIQDARLIDVFTKTRQEVQATSPTGEHVANVQQTIRDTTKNDAVVGSHEGLPAFLSQLGDASTLVLFRRRADVLIASSYYSQANGEEHRLRLADAPTVVKPWLGWLLSEYTESLIAKSEYANLWQQRSGLVSGPFDGEEPDACWALLHRLAAATRTNTIDVAHLRRLVSRPRPPIELCSGDLGYKGPILGTIHASKGREADTVVLVIPRFSEGDLEDANVSEATTLEEGRVYYVGATRARKLLITTGAAAARVSYLDSGRVFRFSGRNRAQLEVGRREDVDRLAQFAWPNRMEVQRLLAAVVGASRPAKAVATKQYDYARRVSIESSQGDTATTTDVGQLSDAFEQDIKALWGRVDRKRTLRPPQTIPHLHVVAVTTVGIPEDLRDGFPPPFNESGIGLAPVVKGFPMLSFVPRRGTGSRR